MSGYTEEDVDYLVAVILKTESEMDTASAIIFWSVFVWAMIGGVIDYLPEVLADYVPASVQDLLVWVRPWVLLGVLAGAYAWITQWLDRKKKRQMLHEIRLALSGEKV